METSRRGEVPPYIGADLTDRHAASPRPVDVCGLAPTGLGRLRASYWEWTWDAGRRRLNVAAVAAEIGAARTAMLDGPQALATRGSDVRICETESNAPGRTPDTPPKRGPYAGFLRSSVALFRALADAEVAVSPPGFVGGVSECYPGQAWALLARRRLPNKGTALGQIARRAMLHALGVQGLPDIGSHDQTDACLAAVLAAAADGAVPGLTIGAVGAALQVDDDGTLREGPMAAPMTIDTALADRIDHALAQPVLQGSLEAIAADGDRVSVRAAPLPAPKPPPAAEPARPKPKPKAKTRTPKSAAADQPPKPTGTQEARVTALLHWLAGRVAAGDPVCCTYEWAHRRIIGNCRQWTPAHTRAVIAAATAGRARTVHGLGSVRLDAFLVAARTRQPGAGHWKAARYTRAAWRKVLGKARLLEPKRR